MGYDEFNVKEEIDREKDIKKTDLNKIFSIFIWSLRNRVNIDALNEIIIFICLYRKALNEYGWQLLGK